MPAPEPMPAEDEPPSKRARTEDSLIPEHHWLARHPQGTVTFCVAVPTVADKPEWRLSGQTLNLTMPLTDMVSVVKARLHDETGLPPGKQKLLGEVRMAVGLADTLIHCEGVGVGADDWSGSSTALMNGVRAHERCPCEYGDLRFGDAVCHVCECLYPGV